VRPIGGEEHILGVAKRVGRGVACVGLRCCDSPGAKLRKEHGGATSADQCCYHLVAEVLQRITGDVANSQRRCFKQLAVVLQRFVGGATDDE
jgi:hypothetical protein